MVDDAKPTAFKAPLPTARHETDLTSQDGFLTYTYVPSHERVVQRLCETKAFLHGEGSFPLCVQFARLPCGVVCGALWMEHMMGFIQGYARTGPLATLRRVHPYGDERGKAYGVRRGRPFDDAARPKRRARC